MFKKKIESVQEVNKNWESYIVPETNECVTRCPHERESDVIVSKMPSLSLVMCEDCAKTLTAKLQFNAVSKK